jgi:hypothetical protein
MRQDIPKLLRSLAMEIDTQEFQRQRADALAHKGLAQESRVARGYQIDAIRRGRAIREHLRRKNFVLYQETPNAIQT